MCKTSHSGRILLKLSGQSVQDMKQSSSRTIYNLCEESYSLKFNMLIDLRQNWCRKIHSVVCIMKLDNLSYQRASGQGTQVAYRLVCKRAKG